jgi:diguanylate cyclase (GGDEF)-like protein
VGCCDRNGEIGEPAPPPLTDALVAWILRDKRPLLVDDLAVKPEPSPRPPFAEGGSGSVLAVPLLVGERPLGLVAVHSASPRAFDEHQVSFLVTIAQQAASSLDAAQRQSSATTDALTGLTLREEFLRQLEAEYLRAKRYPRVFSILVLDLDGFKEVNEQLGHDAGDRYLRELGAAIKDRLRAADTGCRYGGDELCILLPETEFDAAGRLAERLRQTVARLVVDVNGSPVRATASVGISTYPNHDTGTAKGLLLRAEQAVHHAKRGGRNRVA